MYIQCTSYMMTNVTLKEFSLTLNFLNGASIEIMETITNCVMNII
jgi:hypothetical protein